MTEFPFYLKIRKAFSRGPYESVTCKAVLRTIAGKREVYDAIWNNQAVIVKVFLKKISGLYTLKKEWRGLVRLQKSGLNAPKTLFWGQTQDGNWASVVEKITNSATALDIFNKTTDTSKKTALLGLVCKELAKQHCKGIEQKDLHLGNFLVAADRIYAIDTAQMQFHAEPLSREQGISQLALLSCCLPPEDTASIKKFCGEYFVARGWTFGETDLALLQKKADFYTKHGIEKWLKKSLRTSTRYVEVIDDNCNAIFDRAFCDGTKAQEFIKQIDALMDNGEILKNGNTCYVSALTWNGKKIVIKRYNYKSIFYSVYFTAAGSRAKQGWLSGHRLILLNIATPKPVAFIEQWKYSTIRNSYLVTEYVPGQKLNIFLENGSVGNEKKSAITQKVVAILSNLSKNSVSHGDLKHSNILVTGDGPVLTDLDGMRIHRFKWLGRYRADRDMEKFINGTRGNYDITSFMKMPAEQQVK